MCPWVRSQEAGRGPPPLGRSAALISPECLHLGCALHGCMYVYVHVYMQVHILTRGMAHRGENEGRKEKSEREMRGKLMKIMRCR